MKNQPNIFLIVFDTLRKDSLFQNLSRLPNFREFMKSSINFENAISPAPWTIPAHASIFTGLYPSEHGMHTKYSFEDFLNSISSFPSRKKTIPENLNQSGYRTVSVTANQLLGEGTVFGDIFDEVYSVGPLKYELEVDRQIRQILGNQAQKILTPMDIPSVSDLIRNAGVLKSAQVTRLTLKKRRQLRKKGFPRIKGGNQILQKLSSLNLKGSNFVFMNFMESHEPYAGFRDFDSLIREYLKGTLTGHFKGKSRTDKAIATCRRDSVEETLILDKYIGELIRLLKERGIYNNSVVILTSDHGQSFGEDNFVGHGYLLNDALVSVPLIIKPPNGSQVNDSDCVSTMEIFNYIDNCRDGEFQDFPKRDLVFSEAFGFDQPRWENLLGSSAKSHMPEIRKRVWTVDGKNLTINGTRGVVEEPFTYDRPKSRVFSYSDLSSLLEEMEIFVGNDDFLLPSRITADSIAN